MAKGSDGFSTRLERLKADIVEQGRRVQSMLEGAFEALFDRSSDRAAWVIAQDDVIDRVDVEIEKAAVRLLTDACHQGANLEAEQVRWILTIVKINNELERTADAATVVAERAQELSRKGTSLPQTVRVLANSVVGILRDVNRALDKVDPALARVALQSEDAVDHFRAAILADAEARIKSGALELSEAFTVSSIAGQCQRMADYCTNIAEQVIYAAHGAIVRHTESGWVDVDAGGRAT